MGEQKQMSYMERTRETDILPRVFFREKVNLNGEPRWIGKVRKGKESLIVICNIEPDSDCPISSEGKWDVEVVEMRNGKGWIVLDARRSSEVISISREGYVVEVLTNGTSHKLKEGNRYIPLYYDAHRPYSLDKLEHSIRRKAGYLQLEEDFSIDNLIKEFRGSCDEVLQDLLNSGK